MLLVLVASCSGLIALFTGSAVAHRIDRIGSTQVHYRTETVVLVQPSTCAGRRPHRDRNRTVALRADLTRPFVGLAAHDNVADHNRLYEHSQLVRLARRSDTNQ